MRVYRGLSSPALQHPCVLAIGNFDGVHLGHQALLQKLRHSAQQTSATSPLKTRVLSFDPHPREFFAWQKGQTAWTPARITPLRDRLLALAQAGIDEVVLLPFNTQLARMPAQDFIERILLQQLAVRQVWVGSDFCFGAGRLGNVALLQSYAPALQVQTLATVLQDTERVSSSAVRHAFAAGDLRQVAQLMGRPWSLCSHVVHGRKLGRTLGAPTLNQRFGAGRPPALGVCIARVHGLSAQALPAVASLGVRPSLEADDRHGGQVLLESYCLEWPSHLSMAGPDSAYGRCIRTELLHWLHAERTYPSLAALQQGIAQDVCEARAWFAQQR